MVLVDTDKKIFHCCHKCKGIRWTDKEIKIKDFPSLDYCHCMGRTTFEFEEVSRTEKEIQIIKEETEKWYKKQHKIMQQLANKEKD